MTAPDRDRLERAILGETPSLTSAEVAEAAGMPLDDAIRLWRALGFPDTHGAVAFGPADVEALRTIRRAVDAGGLDLDTIVRMTRAVGRTVARLAEWEVGTIGAVVNDVLGAPPEGRTRTESAANLLETIGRSFEQLLVYSWRRHLAVAVARVEGGDSDEDLHVLATVGFADLVGFSALTNQLGDDEIGDLVEVFETRCHDVVAEHNGRIVKTLGDSVLFVGLSAPASIDVALDIIAVIGGDKRLPDVRVGVASGPVVLRMGDVYGPAVNLAARLTAVARRNRVIIDAATAGLLPDADFETRTLPARPVRGFGEIEPIAVRPTRDRHRG